MIDIKSIKNMTNDEINEDDELRQELIKEIVKADIRTSNPKSIDEMSTVELFDIYAFYERIMSDFKK